jgi:nitrite reductase (NADH) large subunit
MTERLLVIGNGMTGARVVEEIIDRGGGDRYSITILGEEPHGNYNRILLSEVLAGSQDPRDIFLNPLDWYEENGIALHAGVTATSVDRTARTVTTSRGSVHAYDKLIFATGARPAFPAVEGLHGPDGELKPGIFSFRTIRDCEAMLAWAQTARRVAVVGGGVLGLEAGRALLERGLEVEIVQRAARLMNLQLNPDSAAMLRTTVEKLGMRVRLDASTTRVLGDVQPEGLQLGDGSHIACDMVVFATGTRPNVQLAARAGFAVERGILVDDGMRALCSDHVYAVGECAEHRGDIYGFVAPAWEQAVVLADRLTGADPDAEYHGSKVATKLKVSGVELASMGVVEPEDDHDELISFSEPKRGIYKTAIVRDGKLVGAILLGDLSRAPFLTQAFDMGTALPEERAGLLFDLGEASSGISVAEPQADELVCLCNGVSRGDIAACVAAGAQTLADVAARTRATTGCGSCKADVLQLVAWATPSAIAA